MDKSPQDFPKGQGGGNSPCKNKQSHNWSDFNWDVHRRINVVVEAASPINPEKGRAIKRKTKDSDHLKDAFTVETNA